MNNRAQLAGHIAIACVAGLLMSGICLHVGLPTTATLLQERQEVTRQQFQSVESELEDYRAFRHAYPQSLSQIPDYFGKTVIASDGWHHPIIYAAYGNSYLLTSYGADGKPGGESLNCDLTNRNPSPPQAQPSTQETWASPLSGGLKGGAMYGGLLTAFLTFRSLNPLIPARRGKGTFICKTILTLVAALFASLLITMIGISSVRH